MSLVNSSQKALEPQVFVSGSFPSSQWQSVGSCMSLNVDGPAAEQWLPSFPLVQPSFAHYWPNFLYTEGLISIVRQACFECLVMTSIWPGRGKVAQKPNDNVWEKWKHSMWLSAAALPLDVCSSLVGMLPSLPFHLCKEDKKVQAASAVHGGSGREVNCFLCSEQVKVRARVTVSEWEGKLECYSTSPTTWRQEDE